MPTIRILLDNNVSQHLARLLSPHEAIHAAFLGWAALGNGELIRAAQESCFTALITCDQNMQHQQNLAGQRLAFIVLTTTHWPTIRDNVAELLAAVDSVGPGGYVTINLPKPPRRRRRYS